MRADGHGFTLIELMVVMAIIAILAAIALPAYSQYRMRSAENACQAEVKNYTNFAVAAIYNDVTIPDPVARACESIDTATDLATPINGRPQAPGIRQTRCNLPTADCTLS